MKMPLECPSTSEPHKAANRLQQDVARGALLSPLSQRVKEETLKFSMDGYTLVIIENKIFIQTNLHTRSLGNT